MTKTKQFAWGVLLLMGLAPFFVHPQRVEAQISSNAHKLMGWALCAVTSTPTTGYALVWTSPGCWGPAAASSVSGSLAGDVTGTLGATVVGTAGGYKVDKLLCGPQVGASDSLVAATITTTETAFATTCTIPANFLVAGVAIRVTYFLNEITSSSAVTQRARFRLGGVTGTLYWDSLAQTVSNSLANRGTAFTCIIQGTGAANTSVNVYVGCQYFYGNTSTPFTISNLTSQPVALATNASQTINLTIQFGGSTAGNEVDLQQMIVESLGT